MFFKNMNTTSNIKSWRLGFFLQGLVACSPQWSLVRRILTVVLVWLYMWVSNIFFGMSNALDYAASLQTIIPFLSLLPQQVIAFVIVLFLPVAGIKFLLVPITAGFLAYWAGARYCQSLYQFSTTKEAFHFLASCIWGFRYPNVVVDDAQLKSEFSQGHWITLTGGPGYLDVRPGNAVLLERFDAPTRILSMGRHYLSRFERISDIIDLKDHTLLVPEETTITKDRIVIKIHDASFRYRIASSARDDIGRGLSTNPYPFSVESIRKLHYNRTVSQAGVTPWEKLVEITAMSGITDYINEHLFDQIINAGKHGNDPRREIINNIQSVSMRNRLRNFGTRLVWFDIGNYSLSEEYESSSLINSWQAIWMGKVAIDRASGEASRLLNQEAGRAEAQAEKLKSIVNFFKTINFSEDTDENIRNVVLAKTAQVFESMNTHFSTSGENPTTPTGSENK
jgi:regulator of protease activity HflC (stomatin/prohibitin superfamily)